MFSNILNKTATRGRESDNNLIGFWFQYNFWLLWYPDACFQQDNAVTQISLIRWSCIGVNHLWFVELNTPCCFLKFNSSRHDASSQSSDIWVTVLLCSWTAFLNFNSVVLAEWLHQTCGVLEHGECCFHVTGGVRACRHIQDHQGQTTGVPSHPQVHFPPRDHPVHEFAEFYYQFSRKKWSAILSGVYGITCTSFAWVFVFYC